MLKLTRRAALAGTVASVASTARAATKVELTSWQTEEPGFSTWWKEVTAAFRQANPSVDLTMTGIPNRDYLDQITVRFASGRPPALVELPSDSLGAFAGQGWLEPLDSRIAGTVIGTKDWSSLQNDLKWDGKTYGVLLMGYAFMMFTNQALLDAAHVTLPSSWDEYCAAVPKITNRDKGIFGLSAVTTEYPTIPMDFLRSIQWPGHSIVNGKAYNLTDPKVIAAVETYRRVVGGNAPLGANSTIIRQLFVDGKTGFLIDGPWVWALLDKAPKDVRPHLKMTRCPFTPPLGGAANSLHIAAGLDRATQDAAWSFIDFIIQPSWQRRYTEVSSAPCARLGVLDDAIMTARPELKLINEAVIGARSAVPAIQALRLNYNEFAQIIIRTAVKVLSTTTPVADILADAQRQLERAVPLS